MFITCVVGWIDVDALYAAFVFGQQGFEGFEVVAVYDAVAAVGLTVVVLLFERAVEYLLMVVDDGIFANPMECGHRTLFLRFVLHRRQQKKGMNYSFCRLYVPVGWTSHTTI